MGNREWNGSHQYTHEELIAAINATRKYCDAILLIVGVVGNTIALAVFAQKSLRHLLVSQLYMVLALVDLCAVVSKHFNALQPWLHYQFEITDIKCKWTMSIASFFHALSPYILMDLGIMRCIGIFFPHKVAIWMTKKPLTMMISIQAVLIGVCLLPLLPAAYEKYDQCFLLDSDSSFESVMFWLSIMTVTYGLPLIALTSINIGIIIGLTKAQQKRGLSVINPKRNYNAGIAMLLTNSFAYILLSFHKPIALMMQRVMSIEPRSRLYWEVKLYDEIGDVLVYPQHCINVFLYCAAGKDFRHTLLHVVTCGKFSGETKENNRKSGNVTPTT